MNLTPRLDEAVKLASRLHRNQTRKDSVQSPYVSHLVSVAMIISSVTDDEDIIISGLMHDSLEDVPNYTFENLVADCGPRVAEIVKHVTEPLDANKLMEEQLPWLVRQEIYLKNLKEGGIESAIVSSADKIHNTESFLVDIVREDGEFLKKFHSSLRNKVWFYEEVLKTVTEKLGNDHALVLRFSKALQSFKTFAENYEQK